MVKYHPFMGISIWFAYLRYLSFKSTCAQILAQGMYRIEALEWLAKREYIFRSCCAIFKRLQKRFVCR